LRRPLDGFDAIQRLGESGIELTKRLTHPLGDGRERA
jgi:hypothetical protein